MKIQEKSSLPWTFRIRVEVTSSANLGREASSFLGRLSELFSFVSDADFGLLFFTEVLLLPSVSVSFALRTLEYS